MSSANPSIVVTLCIGFKPIEVEFGSRTYQKIAGNLNEAKRALGALIRVIELIREEDHRQQKQMAEALICLQSKLTETMKILGMSEYDAQAAMDSALTDLSPAEVRATMNAVRKSTN